MKKRRVPLLVSFLILLTGSMYLTFIWIRTQADRSHVSTVHSDANALYQKVRNGQLDDAIAEEEAALQKDPKNLGIVRGLGTICLLKASKAPPSESEQWISKAADYGTKLGASASRTNVLDIADVYQAGKILEGAGDLSGGKCLYYEQARKVLEKDGPVVKKGTTITLYGTTQSLDQVLVERDKLEAEIGKKLVASHCAE
ncbi:MAG: hypothetical protein ACRD25_11835 [Terracidiphilus sp.]